MTDSANKASWNRFRNFVAASTAYAVLQMTPGAATASVPTTDTSPATPTAATQVLPQSDPVLDQALAGDMDAVYFRDTNHTDPAVASYYASPAFMESLRKKGIKDLYIEMSASQTFEINDPRQPGAKREVRVQELFDDLQRGHISRGDFVDIFKNQIHISSQSGKMGEIYADKIINAQKAGIRVICADMDDNAIRLLSHPYTLIINGISASPDPRAQTLWKDFINGSEFRKKAILENTFENLINIPRSGILSNDELNKLKKSNDIITDPISGRLSPSNNYLSRLAREYKGSMSDRLKQDGYIANRMIQRATDGTPGSFLSGEKRKFAVIYGQLHEGIADTLERRGLKVANVFVYNNDVLLPFAPQPRPGAFCLSIDSKGNHLRLEKIEPNSSRTVTWKKTTAPPSSVKNPSNNAHQAQKAKIAPHRQSAEHKRAPQTRHRTHSL